MDENESRSGLREDETEKTKVNVVGFPEPAEVISLSAARGNRKAAIRVRLDLLEEKGADQFGDKSLQKLANALANLAESIEAIDPQLEGNGFEVVGNELMSFEILPDDGRQDLGFFEKLKGRQPPFAQLLNRLEVLSNSFPSFGEAQESEWNNLSTAYKRTQVLAQEVADCVAAGKVRLSKVNADLKPAHEKALEERPEDRGQEAESALLALRAARDDVERKIHALRGTHKQALSLLLAIRELAQHRQEFRRQRKFIEARALPKWEETVSSIIRDFSSKGKGLDPETLDRLKVENDRLGGLLIESGKCSKKISAAYKDGRSLLHPVER